MQHDKPKIENLTGDQYDSCSNLKIRLGKPSSTKPRSIKLVTKSKANAIKILKHLKEKVIKNVRSDQTVMQQAYLRDLKLKLEERLNQPTQQSNT